MFAAFEFDPNDRSEDGRAHVGPLRIETERIDQVTTTKPTSHERQRCDRRARTIGVEPEVSTLQRTHAALARTLSMGTISAHS